MKLDAKDYPKGYTFAEVVSQAIGVHVGVADFQEHRGRHLFRMILDPELNAQQIIRLMDSQFTDSWGTYRFHHLESICGPVVDRNARQPNTHYIRVTYL